MDQGNPLHNCGGALKEELSTATNAGTPLPAAATTPNNNSSRHNNEQNQLTSTEAEDLLAKFGANDRTEPVISAYKEFMEQYSGTPHCTAIIVCVLALIVQSYSIFIIILIFLLITGIRKFIEISKIVFMEHVSCNIERSMCVRH